ncbi:hypothetical protein [Hymenobacter sp. BT190]|uniref:hypothetical protein n=1 Tax=Hymenobacter sp. BT190 TaxID=2763505 RepID=UPI00165167C0|nr:hypothetical protein [Hymenobacter sp. BT190]MBC6697406.1 hypothetical protein [Hymenobacter sp. BT190]
MARMFWKLLVILSLLASCRSEKVAFPFRPAAASPSELAIASTNPTVVAATKRPMEPQLSEPAGRLVTQRPIALGTAPLLPKLQRLDAACVRQIKRVPVVAAQRLPLRKRLTASSQRPQRSIRPILFLLAAAVLALVFALGASTIELAFLVLLVSIACVAAIGALLLVRATLPYQP